MSFKRVLIVSGIGLVAVALAMRIPTVRNLVTGTQPAPTPTIPAVQFSLF